MIQAESAAAPRQWSLRNNNNYEQTGLLVSLNYFATNRLQFLQTFYEKSKRRVLEPKTEGPAAWVLSANDSRLGAEAELLSVLRKQHVEISRATASFSVTVPAPARASRTGRAAQDSATASPKAATEMETRHFPPDRTSSAWTSHTRARPTRCWTSSTGHRTIRRRHHTTTLAYSFPIGFAVQAVRVTDMKVLDAPMER